MTQQPKTRGSKSYCSGCSGVRKFGCESSVVCNTMQPQGNENAPNAISKMVPQPPQHTSRKLRVADGSSEPLVPRYRMSLWEFECSQRCTVMATTEFSQQVFSTLQGAIWFEMGGPHHFQNDTQEFSCVSNNPQDKNPNTHIPCC